MVGVPGKSKGCNTCRKRKIRCDQEKPTCKQCIKSNRVCEGYQRERIFHHTVTRRSVQFPKSPKSQDRHAVGVRTFTVRMPPPTLDQDVDPDHRNTAGRPKLVVYGRPLETTPLTIPDSPNPVNCNKSGFFGTLYELYNPGSCIAYALPTDWLIAAAPRYLGVVPAVDSAVMAVATAHIGRLQDNEALLVESMRIYGKALVQVRDALAVPEMKTQNATLVSVLALKMYEQTGYRHADVDCDLDQSYVDDKSHDKGILDLIRLRYPESFTSGLSHRLLESFQGFAWTNAFFMRVPNFLLSERWRTIPWRHQKKTLLQRLYDVVSPFPYIAQDHDQGRVPREELLVRCGNIMVAMQDWRTEMEAEYPIYPHYWRVPSEFASDDPNNPFTERYEFASPEIGRLLINYWGFHLLILAESWVIGASLDPSRVTSIPAVWELGKKVCRSLEYWMKPERRCTGHLVLIFALGSASNLFLLRGQQGRYWNWLKDILERLAERGLISPKYMWLRPATLPRWSDSNPKLQGVYILAGELLRSLDEE